MRCGSMFLMFGRVVEMRVPAIHCHQRNNSLMFRSILHLSNERSLSFLKISRVSFLTLDNKYSTFSNTILNRSPSSLKPFLRLIRFDKPIGTMLLFWPGACSIALASPAGCLPDLHLLSLFLLGSFFMRGAGCIINDLWDSDIDSKVARTRERPIASGELTTVNALLMLGFQLSGALAILLQLNWPSIALGTMALVPVVVYPTLKRITYWPQAFLGLTFNWGALLGWTSVTGGLLSSPSLALYFAGIFWTLLYDTIYALQDKEDDLLVGVKSTALLFGERTKPALTIFSLGMLSCLACAGSLTAQTLPYYLGLSIMGGHLAYQTTTLNISCPDDCAAKFRSNNQLGFILFCSIVAGTLFKRSTSSLNVNNNDDSFVEEKSYD